MSYISGCPASLQKAAAVSLFLTSVGDSAAPAEFHPDPSPGRAGAAVPAPTRAGWGSTRPRSCVSSQGCSWLGPGEPRACCQGPCQETPASFPIAAGADSTQVCYLAGPGAALIHYSQSLRCFALSQVLAGLLGSSVSRQWEDGGTQQSALCHESLAPPFS